MEATILSRAAYLYGQPEGGLIPVSGGHYASVYEFSKGGTGHILRITPPDGELDLRSTQAILEWMHFLAQAGAPVSRPVFSENHQLIEVCVHDGQTYLVVAYEKAPGILAEELAFERWGPVLWERLGRTVGWLHALAQAYLPRPYLRRPDWDSIHNCYNPVESKDTFLAAFQEKRKQILDHLRFLPKDPGGYGLIHADLHGGNFLLDEGSGTITILDFDDCCYGWFGMDIAMNILDMAVLYPGLDKDAFARQFLHSYLKGYRTENELSPFWAGQLPWFLKLLETGLYMQCYPLYDPQDRDSWVGRFMADRLQRIESEAPFVEIDFLAVLEAARQETG